MQKRAKAYSALQLCPLPTNKHPKYVSVSFFVVVENQEQRLEVKGHSFKQQLEIFKIKARRNYIVLNHLTQKLQT